MQPPSGLQSDCQGFEFFPIDVDPPWLQNARDSGRQGSQLIFPIGFPVGYRSTEPRFVDVVVCRVEWMPPSGHKVGGY
jgi:hypothetical protein